ncbi:GNAT family N-acetyltransferase [Candidatus Acetothermia bacterium]|jgi:GNAT superfamily N-acetyltransferase|nr:GNAT family N-acetyltransferase [Candidatus Acetothermia bacterium]MCI2435839.1 GNAT family N-acetyltransferase [Candidatus Acetothermia bacterium]
MTQTIKVFDPHKAGASEFEAWNKFSNQMKREMWPEDPPTELEEEMRDLRSIPPFWEVRFWAVWCDNKIVAIGEVELSRTGDNQHLAWFEIQVPPEMRRQGVAKRLLKPITEVAQKERRRLMMTWTDSAIPAGEAFMKRLGARVGMVSGTNQLNLADLRKDLVRDWQARAPKTEFELGLWSGPYPEQEIEAIVKLREVMNTAPRDSLEMEDFHRTPEQLRQVEASLAERKTERCTLYVREKKTGKLAGYTEVFWSPFEPETLYQGDTGVFPEYRGHGLGKWLKAAMLEEALHDRPQVKRIRTGNANSNAPMLKINYELGFKPYKSWTAWQIELEKVLEYLKTAQ